MVNTQGNKMATTGKNTPAEVSGKTSEGGDTVNPLDVVGSGATANTSAGDANENVADGTDPQAGGLTDGTQTDADPLGYGEK